MPIRTCEETNKLLNETEREVQELRQKVVRLQAIVTNMRVTMMANSVNSAIPWQERIAFKAMLEHLKKMTEENSIDTTSLEECIKAGYELSTYAAAIHWDGRENEPEWMEGLEERIVKVQELVKKHGLEVE